MPPPSPPCSAMQYNAVQCSTMQYNATPPTPSPECIGVHLFMHVPDRPTDPRLHSVSPSPPLPRSPHRCCKVSRGKMAWQERKAGVGTSEVHSSTGTERTNMHSIAQHSTVLVHVCLLLVTPLPLFLPSTRVVSCGLPSCAALQYDTAYSLMWYRA
jgi:hypothetical protein